MQFRAKFSIPKIDVSKYTKALEDEMEVQIRQAARAWLRAVIPRVPVWAGTARGSLRPLGTYLRVAIPISPVVQRTGQGPSVGESQGSYSFTRKGHKFGFTASTSVQHFITNDFYQVPDPPFHLKNPTPWKAFEAGSDAFNEYIKTTLVSRIPRIKEYLQYKTVTIR